MPLKNEKNKENSPPSPVKAVLSTPPRPQNQQAFFFPKTSIGGKTHGLTPNGKTRIPLNPHEGKHHNRVRNLAAPALIVDGDTPLDPIYKNNFEAQKLQLDAQLLNLKKRSDFDYKLFTTTKTIEPGHFHAAVRKINENIQQLKLCYQLAHDGTAFVKELNDRIVKGDVYNPFGLRQIYSPTGDYKDDLARDPAIYQGLLMESSLNPQPIAKAAPLKSKPATLGRGLFDDVPPAKLSCESGEVLPQSTYSI